MTESGQYPWQESGPPAWSPTSSPAGDRFGGEHEPALGWDGGAYSSPVWAANPTAPRESVQGQADWAEHGSWLSSAPQGQPQWATAAAVAAPRPADRPVDAPLLLLAGSAALCLLGLFLPWGTATLAGAGSTSVGHGLAGLLSTGFALWSIGRALTRPSLRNRHLAGSQGVWSGGFLCLILLVFAAQLYQRAGSYGASFSPGPGFVVVLLGAVGLIVLGHTVRKAVQQCG